MAVHKKGSTNDVKNYRPTFILPFIAKTFLRVIINRISLKITLQLHGFRRDRSSSTNRLIFQTDILDAFGERKPQVDAVEIVLANEFEFVSWRESLETVDFLVLYFDGFLAIFGEDICRFVLTECSLALPRLI